jgi:hypothetical protein
MAIAYNTSIVRNGLVLYLDAANVKSYPGSGTAWTDLSGNGNNGTLVNGVGYNTNNNGYFVQDNIDDYISTNYTLPVSNFTVSMWSQRTSSTYWSMLWANDFWNNATGYIANFDEENTLYFARAGTYPQVNPTIIPNSSNWSYYCFTIDTSSNFNVYYNSTLLNSYTSTITSVTPNTIKIGARHTNNNSGITDTRFGNHGMFSVYNRVLTAAEVSQNFNALRGRYNV